MPDWGEVICSIHSLSGPFSPGTRAKPTCAVVWSMSSSPMYVSLTPKE